MVSSGMPLPATAIPNINSGTRKKTLMFYDSKYIYLIF